MVLDQAQETVKPWENNIVEVMKLKQAFDTKLKPDY